METVCDRAVIDPIIYIVLASSPSRVNEFALAEKWHEAVPALRRYTTW
mgnify:CR=1 FL=1